MADIIIFNDADLLTKRIAELIIYGSKKSAKGFRKLTDEKSGCKIFCVNSLKGVQGSYNDAWLEREGA